MKCGLSTSRSAGSLLSRTLSLNMTYAPSCQAIKETKRFRFVWPKITRPTIASSETIRFRSIYEQVWYAYIEMLQRDAGPLRLGQISRKLKGLKETYDGQVFRKAYWGTPWAPAKGTRGRGRG